LQDITSHMLWKMILQMSAFSLIALLEEFIAKYTFSVYLIFFSLTPQGFWIDTQNPSRFFD
jgi:hypothetical protein